MRHERSGIHAQEDPPPSATVLSADQKLACILPEVQGLHLLVPITALSFYLYSAKDGWGSYLCPSG